MLFVGFVVYFVVHPEGRFRSGRAHGDGTYYYAYLRSLAFDRDLDFTNDYKIVGNQFGFGAGPRKRPANPFTIGPAVYWAPFFAVAHGVAAVGNGAGWLQDPMDGNSDVYQRVTFFGSLVWGFGAIVLCVLLLRHYFSEGLALVGGLAVALATPLPWYMTRQPCFSHAVDAFAVAALVVYWHRTLWSRSLRQWIALGLLAGLAMLVRPQNLGFLLLPFGEGLILLVRRLRVGERREAWRLVGRGCACIAAALLAFSPQMLAWHHIYGHLVTVPQGGSFLMLAHSKWAETLLSSRNGLFAWHPLIYAGVIGLFLLPLRTSLPSRAAALALLGLVALAFQAYINGSVSDWWAGWAFGGRRYSSSTVLFAVGFASFFWYLGRVLRRAGPVLLAAAPALVVALLAVCNLSLMKDYTEGRVRYASSQEMSTFWKRAAERAVDTVYGWTGNLGSIPASWIFAARAGVSPARFDEVSGAEILDGRSRQTISFTSSKLVMSGFGDPLTYRDVPGRVLDRDGTVVFSLRKPRDLSGAIKVCPALPGSRLALLINGHLVLDATLREGWQEHAFKIAAGQLDAGLNYVSLWHKPSTRPAARTYPIGTTGRSSVELSAESAGYEAGNAMRFVVGRDTFSWPQRGLHAATVELPAGRLRYLGVFDTYKDASAAARLARRIDALPKESVVLLAAKDEASKRWTEAADGAIRALGGRQSLRGRYRWSYALIGVKGARPGQAVEALASRRVAVHVGRPPELRTSGVACATLELARQPAKPPGGRLLKVLPKAAKPLPRAVRGPAKAVPEPAKPRPKAAGPLPKAVPEPAKPRPKAAKPDPS